LLLLLFSPGKQSLCQKKNKNPCSRRRKKEERYDGCGGRSRKGGERKSLGKGSHFRIPGLGAKVYVVDADAMLCFDAEANVPKFRTILI
jgi:hypothetical protein